MFDFDVERLKSVQLREKVIIRIYNRDNVAEACAGLGINPAALAIARVHDPEFDAAVRQAQAATVDMMVDRLENIQDEEENPIMARVMSDNIKWLAGKRYRQIYGEKLDVTHTITVDLRGAIEEARNRTLQHFDDKPLIQHSNQTDSISVSEAVMVEEEEEIDPLS